MSNSAAVRRVELNVALYWHYVSLVIPRPGKRALSPLGLSPEFSGGKPPEKFVCSVALGELGVNGAYVVLGFLDGPAI